MRGFIRLLLQNCKIIITYFYAFVGVDLQVQSGECDMKDNNAFQSYALWKALVNEWILFAVFCQSHFFLSIEAGIHPFKIFRYER